MASRYALLVLGGGFILVGCASQGIKPAARLIGDQTAAFQADLSSFAEELAKVRTAEQNRVEGMDARRDIAVAGTNQERIAWTVADAKNETEAFAALQQQGQSEVDRLLADQQATRTRATLSVPTEGLGSVAKIMNALANGGDLPGDLKVLETFASAIGAKLKDVQTADKAKTRGAPAAK